MKGSFNSEPWLVDTGSSITSRVPLVDERQKRLCHNMTKPFSHNMVGDNGFEPSTPSMSTRYSNQLS